MDLSRRIFIATISNYIVVNQGRKKTPMLYCVEGKKEIPHFRNNSDLLLLLLSSIVLIHFILSKYKITCLIFIFIGRRSLFFITRKAVFEPITSSKHI